jgi:hypothetical protein
MTYPKMGLAQEEGASGLVKKSFKEAVKGAPIRRGKYVDMGGVGIGPTKTQTKDDKV